MKKALRERSARLILIENIIIDEGPRPINEEAVRSLANSMATFGMHTPIQVESALRPDGRGPGNVDEFFYHVIAGRHRIAAAKSLGWDRIEAIDFFDNPYFDRLSAAVEDSGEDPDYSIAARMWAIAENLKRCELTALERDSQIAEWIELEKQWKASLAGVSSQLETKPSGGRPEGGVRAAARELGIERNEAHRATKVASLSEEAKATAVEVGLDDNRTALLAAARAEPAEQARIIRDYAEKKESDRNRIDTDVKARAAREVASMLAEHVPGEWWDALKANLYAAGASNIAAELTNITGQSIMDRRFA